MGLAELFKKNNDEHKNYALEWENFKNTKNNNQEMMYLELSKKDFDDISDKVFKENIQLPQIQKLLEVLSTQ